MSDKSQDANKIHEEAVVIDGQGVAVLLPVVQIPPAPIDGVSFLDRAARGGLTALNVTLGIGGIGMGEDNFKSLLHTINGHFCYFEIEPRLIHVRTGEDIRRAKREGKLGVIFGLQGLAPKIDDEPAFLRILHALGLRIGQLTYNERSSIGCGCLETPDTGLTQMGRICVREMNHLGIAVDLAHAGQRTTLDTIEHSSEPVIISHGNARALTDSARNYTDETLGALAERGGVIGITAYGPFCQSKPGVRPTLDDMVNHIAYVAERFGIDHVGVGSDFFEAESEVRFHAFFGVRYPDVFREFKRHDVYFEDFNRVEHLPMLTDLMSRRGFSGADIAKVLGGNFLRVFDQVWRGHAP